MKIRTKKKRQERLTAVDLFAGCGGLTLGLKNAGFKVLAAVEIDATAADAYRLNHASTTLLQQDVSTVTAGFLLETIKQRRGELHLLAGCPPCQGFSRLTTKNGKAVNDPRNFLITDFQRLVVGLLPKCVLLENVPGLAKDSRFKELLDVLEILGYRSEWAVLNAAAFGVPQRRKRLIMISSRVGSIPLPEGDEITVSVKKTIGDLPRPGKSKDRLHRLVMKNSKRIKKLISKIPDDGGSRSALGARAQLACHKKTKGFRDIYGRMKWEDVSPTITSGCTNPSKGRFLHPVQDRPISIREAALLQTFPKRYRFPVDVGITKMARLVGDALPPIFALRQGRQIASFLLELKNHKKVDKS